MLENILSKQRIKIADRLIPLEHRNGRILDIGCGEVPGFLLKTRFREKHGIDRLFKDNIAYKDISIKNAEITKETLMFFNDGYFDVITMLAVFEHLEPDALPMIIKEIQRILRPGGIFIMTTPAPWVEMILHCLAKLRMVSPEMIKEHKGLYSIEDILTILGRAGFLKSSIKFGHFELYMNNWVMAAKQY